MLDERTHRAAVTANAFWGSKVSQDTSVDDKRRLVGELLQRAASGVLHLPVEAIFDLADVAAAARASRAARARSCSGPDHPHVRAGG